MVNDAHRKLMESACPGWLLEAYDKDPGLEITSEGRTMTASAWVQDCLDCWITYGRLLDI